MPDYAADPTSTPETAEPGGHEKPVAGDHEAVEPTVRCSSCGSDVVPREGSYGLGDSKGLVCPSCGAQLEDADAGSASTTPDELLAD